MTRASHHWKKGSAVKSLKALNASVHDSLPKSTEGICQSLSAFTRILLGYNKLDKSYPPGPTPDERCRLRPLSPAQIMSDRRVFSTNPILLGDELPDESPVRFKNFCQMDLEQHGITQMTFDWSVVDRDPWNRTMATFIVKHWQYARSQGGFNHHSVDPAHNTEEICMGVVLRWMRGRAEEIRQGR